MTYLKGSDGLLYEDLATKLLSEPAQIHHNRVVVAARKAGREEEAIRVYSHHYEEGEGWNDPQRHNYAQGAVERAGYRRLPSGEELYDFGRIAQGYAAQFDQLKKALAKKLDEEVYKRFLAGQLGGDKLTGQRANFIVYDDPLADSDRSGHGRIGEPDAFETALVAVRAADQPAVHGGLGAPGHLSAPGEVFRRRSERPLAALDAAATAARWEVRVEQPKLSGVAPRTTP